MNLKKETFAVLAETIGELRIQIEDEKKRNLALNHIDKSDFRGVTISKGSAKFMIRKAMRLPEEVDLNIV